MISLVVALDLAIFLAYILWIYIAKGLIVKEATEFDSATVSITDFALKITNLPDLPEYKDEMYLKAMLTNHI